MEEKTNTLWEAVQLGDQSAFEKIYLQAVPQLYREISRRISDRVVVEDMIQELFLTLWERRNIYQPKGDIYAYLYGMAINRVLNYYRSHKKQPQVLAIWENLPEDLLGLEELSAAFKQAHTEELENLLDKAIQQLPQRMKEVYHLRFEEKKTVPQIAQFLHTSPNTVNNQLKEIRKRFIKTLKETSYMF